MKTLLPCVAALAATTLALASPTDDVKAAAKKLADAANYSWSTSTQSAGGGGGFGGGTTAGVTEKGGFTVITRETPMGSMQTVMKGEKVAMEREGEWMTMEEMMAQFGGGGGAPGGGRGGPGGGRGGRGGMFGANAPADEVAALVDQVQDLKAADGALVGALKPEAVAQRLRFGRGGRGGGGGQPPAPPANASGSVKFWLKDGVIAKYELNVKGTVQGPDGEMQMDRTTTTEIKNVGSTKVTVPEGAKKKLGA